MQPGIPKSILYDSVSRNQTDFFQPEALHIVQIVINAFADIAVPPHAMGILEENSLVDIKMLFMMVVIIVVVVVIITMAVMCIIIVSIVVMRVIAVFVTGPILTMVAML